MGETGLLSEFGIVAQGSKDTSGLFFSFFFFSHFFPADYLWKGRK